MRINNSNESKNNLHFKNLSALSKPLGAFYNANATIPTFIIETGVTAGRTFEANKKGGKIEAQERFIEQGSSAIIWIWGVQALQKVTEKLGSKILKIQDLDFDIGFDYLRNPLENLSKKAVKFKAASMLINTAILTAFIGFGLPKINHFLTKKMMKKENNIKEKSLLKTPDFKEFKKQTAKKNVSFTSLYENGLKAANILQNNSTARLFATDTGVVAGRFHNARNKFEKIECLFRDIASIYFYLFSTHHIVKLLNKATSNADIDPKTLEKTVEMLRRNLKKSSTITDEHNFINKAAGSARIKDLRKIDELFKDKKAIEVEEFKKTFAGFKEKADAMAQLQPELDGKRILSKIQAQDVVKNGWVSDPEFLKSAYEAATDGAYKEKHCFVSAKKIERIRTSIDEFILQIQKKAKEEGVVIDEKFVEKIAKNNIRKNFAFYSAATAVSMFALGILIPKIQYLIRRKLTNNDEFVGIKDYK